MEKENYQDEFEQFLQDEVKQHRMYPSDHIWKNIRTEMHGYKAWPALTFISLFIITALTVSTILINHPTHYLVKVKNNSTTTQRLSATKTAILPLTAINSTETASEQYFHQITPEVMTANTFLPIEPIQAIQESVAGPEKRVNTQPYHPSLDLIIPSQIFTKADNTVGYPNAEQNTINPALHSTVSFTEESKASEETLPFHTNVENTKEAYLRINSQQPIAEKITTADDYFKAFPYTPTIKTTKKISKFGIQFYVTPSTSYRTLSDEKVKEMIQPTVASAGVVNQNTSFSLSSSTYSNDVNNIVRHRPAIGLELGFAILYNLTNKLHFKTGLQLNIRQYYIETFQSRTNDLSTISLINNRSVETFSFYSPYNNNTGYKKTELDNKIYQVSIPIGIQWDFIQGKHFGINTEASIQPTLLLNTNTYLLSTDYKHYTDGDGFIRKWNINTSMGLNFTYKTGTSSWQIGPQIRYQHLPTYSNLYPIKEYLIDYGVRVGFTKQIN